MASPKKELVVISTDTDDGGNIFTQIDLKGNIILRTVVPKLKDSTLFTNVFFDKQGEHYCQSWQRGPDRKPVFKYYRLTPSGLVEVDKSQIQIVDDEEDEVTVTTKIVPYPKETGLTSRFVSDILMQSSRQTAKNQPYRQRYRLLLT